MGVNIIARKDKLFLHFGILLESKRVLHYASKTNNMFASNQLVRNDDLCIFGNGRKIISLCQINGIEEKVIVKRAEEYYGKGKKYSLRNNNCITFVLWCLNGKSKFNIYDVANFYISKSYYCFLRMKNLPSLKID